MRQTPRSSEASEVKTRTLKIAGMRHPALAMGFGTRNLV
jgi:hypothetical protein